MLAGWGLRVRGLGPLRVWRVDRFEQRRPFRLLRRPIELGAMAAAAGAAILRNSPTVWVCLAAWILVWNIMLELGDWELRQRLPACRDYIKRTPRYLPRPTILQR
jgi:protein-S-isoprenylcysteine O-methyltransferase Ste14